MPARVDGRRARTNTHTADCKLSTLTEARGTSMGALPLAADHRPISRHPMERRVGRKCLGCPAIFVRTVGRTRAPSREPLPTHHHLKQESKRCVLRMAWFL